MHMVTIVTVRKVMDITDTMIIRNFTMIAVIIDIAIKSIMGTATTIIRNTMVDIIDKINTKVSITDMVIIHTGIIIGHTDITIGHTSTIIGRTSILVLVDINATLAIETGVMDAGKVSSYMVED